MNSSFFIARRLYAKDDGAKRASRPAILIATFGVAIGLAVMILAVAIALGFRDEISSKITGIGSHITILNSGISANGENGCITLDEQLIKELRNVGGIKHIQQFSTKSGILKTQEQFEGITLKGIGADYDTGFIASHIIEGTLPNYSKSTTMNDIVISQSVANDLKVGVGDKIYAYFFESGLRARRFTVAAIYRTDMSQFDKILVFAHGKTVKNLCKLNDTQASGLEINIKDFSQLYEVSLQVAKKISRHNISKNTSYSSFNIKEMYAQIFDWLNLLNVNIWVILILMLAVTGVTIVSGLLILILERTGTIALLKALGASNTFIQKIFINFAVFILLKGMIIGNILGLTLAAIQKYFNILHFPNPEDYYLDSIPIEFNVGAIVIINITTFVISAMVLVLPSYLVARVHPSKVLRFE